MLEQMEMPLPLSKSEERELLKVFREDRNARNILIERNLRLIPMMIHKHFRNTTWEDEDLFGIGTIGLVKAVDSYKVDSGISLSTYITTCVRNEIFKNLRKEHRKRMQVDDIINEDSEGNITYIWDTLSADDDTYKEVEKEEISVEIHRCVSTLNGRERTLVEHRFGMITDEPLTQKEVSKILGCSKSYVGVLEKKVLTRLSDMLSTVYFD